MARMWVRKVPKLHGQGSGNAKGFMARMQDLPKASWTEGRKGLKLNGL